MARPSDPTIRVRLRDQAIDYVLSHGVMDFSLRPLARALKTNARMLIYHFGSRERLMREILAGLREREDAVLKAWFAKKPGSRTLAEFLQWYWKRMSDPRARPALRMIFELYALALRDPKSYPGVLTEPIAHWEDVTKNVGVRSTTQKAKATLLLAATRGLLLDLCATGETTRIDQAVKLLHRLTS